MKAQFTYVGIRVKDVDESVNFYTKILGMKKQGEPSKNERTKGVTVGLESADGGFTLELNYYEKDSPYHSEYLAGEALDHLAFKVEDLDRALEEAKRAGYHTVSETKTPESRWAYIQDPNGIWIELF